MMGAIGMLFPLPPGSSARFPVAAALADDLQTPVSDIGIEFGPRPSLFKPNREVSAESMRAIPIKYMVMGHFGWEPYDQ